MEVYPLVMTNIAMENGPVEIVDFPSYRMVDLSIVFCKRLPEGILIIIIEIHNWIMICDYDKWIMIVTVLLLPSGK